MPLVGLGANAVVDEVRHALADDARIERLEPRSARKVGSRPDEHVTVAVRFLGPSAESARQLADEWN